MKLGQTKILYLISWATDFAYILAIFTITRMLAEGSATLMQSGILGAIGTLSYAGATAVSGHLSYRVGRRRVVGFGAGLTMLLMIVGAQVQTVAAMYLLIGLLGIGVGFIYPSVIAALTAGEQDGRKANRTLFLFCLSWNLGMICGQSGGGFLFRVNPAASIYLGAALMAIVLGLVLCWQPSAPATREAAAAPSAANARGVLFTLMAWVSNLAAAFAFSLIIYIFPHLATELGISPALHGGILSGNRCLAVLIYLVMHATVFWHYRLAANLWALAMAFAGLSILAVASAPAVVCGGLLLIGAMVGYNYFASIYYSTTAFAEDRKGLASGIHEATLAVGQGGGALLGGWVGMQYGLRAPFRLGAMVMLLAAAAQIALYLGARQRLAQPRPGEPALESRGSSG